MKTKFNWILFAAVLLLANQALSAETTPPKPNGASKLEQLKKTKSGVRDVGNGGDAVVCWNEDGRTIKSVELLDTSKRARY